MPRKPKPSAPVTVDAALPALVLIDDRIVGSPLGPDVDGFTSVHILGTRMADGQGGFFAFAEARGVRNPQTFATSLLVPILD